MKTNYTVNPETLEERENQTETESPRELSHAPRVRIGKTNQGPEPK
jgi:hypothetical protein